ncbi:MFS transporter [Qipengyuania citrea]|jgi:predicted MFS family arabinose efflux permease|uniref:MFS transporter n=1 Tax=Qipengyuania citrea TaxID=225971 RepID=A0ABY4U243_9SPHN|nr:MULTISPECIES: MFS transporter [Erythrobacteraceae]MEE2795000.1 MFS transporter [Pseudomonadota bacterium]PNQ76321.1 MFS transporter [Erythrobacter sp. SAORIC-644]USA60179.1 MFS transporter [Qipengyuania citrea]|tara:strand:+ start:3166 stop:4500 length:1335 start_codon:yes stop_codon:yes gene_type:complete
MFTATHLLRRRRFLPLFVTQLFNAFNDNLYKTTMVLFVVYAVYNDETTESSFSSLASALFILPFFILSALAGQLADMRDKAKIIRTVKMCEIGLMMIGAAGLYMAWRGIMVHTVAIPLLLLALFLTGVQSTFLGPIKYAILPQHLKKDEVLAGTGLVEAGTYIAILMGTILAGPLAVDYTGWAAMGIIVVSCIGYMISRQIPPAPPLGEIEKLDWHVLRASVKLVRDTMHNAEVYYAILAISFFWTIGAVLFIQFPPLAKNTIMASPEVASLFLVVFSIGVAIGSVAVNALLKGKVSARYSPASVIVMGLFVVAFYVVAKLWEADQPADLLDVGEFIAWPMASLLMLCLLGISVAGGMFVVPLYAFLTTRVSPDKASRTIAANNIVNSGAMVGGSLLAMALSAVGVPITEQILLCAAMCLFSAWLAKRLIAAENEAAEIAAGAI